MINYRKFIKDSCERCKNDDARLLIVHHKNRNREDNRPDNLQTLCYNCHRLVHVEINSTIKQMTVDYIESTGFVRILFTDPIPMESFPKDLELMMSWRKNSQIISQGLQIVGVIVHPDDWVDFLTSRRTRKSNIKSFLQVVREMKGGDKK